MAEPLLLRAFRFQVSLRRSPGGAGAAGTSASAGATASISATAGFSASAGVGASAGGSASVGVGGLGAAASASFSASVSASVGAALAVGGPTGDLLGNGAFQECSGIEIEQDVGEIVQGGRNDSVVKRVGRAKFENIVLKRGMLFSPGASVDGQLWRWIQDVVRGVRPVLRFDGTIDVLDAGETVVATWHFRRGLPARLRGPTLNAQTGEIGIEELHIAHEGLVLGDFQGSR
jgi:phage tail-like protein